MEESTKAPSGNTCLDRKECNGMYQLVFNANLTIDSADNPGGNSEIVPKDEQHVRRQLKADPHVLTKVIMEKNVLQDANVRLDVELKDIRAQLADSVKENKML